MPRSAEKVSILIQNCRQQIINGAVRRKHFNVLHGMILKEVKLTKKRENREEIHLEQEKHPWITV